MLMILLANLGFSPERLKPTFFVADFVDPATQVCRLSIPATQAAEKAEEASFVSGHDLGRAESVIP